MRRKNITQNSGKKLLHRFQRRKINLLTLVRGTGFCSHLLQEEELSRLTKDKKKEVDSEEYQHFLNCLDTLTAKENFILDLYTQGKSSKEILSIANITENTLKYHNRNIYIKLGVKSRKQLLMYITLMKQNTQ